LSAYKNKHEVLQFLAEEGADLNIADRVSGGGVVVMMQMFFFFNGNVDKPNFVYELLLG